MEYLVIFIFVVFIIIYSNLKRHNYPPGPFPYPIFGNASIVKRLSKKYNGLPNAFTELSKLYNSDIFSLKLGRENAIIVTSEDLMKEVLFREEFQGRPDNFFIRLRSMGNRRGITMTDGALWHEQRTFASKHLHEHGLGKRRMDYIIQKQLQDFLVVLSKWNGNSIQLRKSISKCVLNVLWEIVTGSPFQNEQKLNDLVSFMEERAKAFDMNGGLLAQFPFLSLICPEYSGYNLIQKLNVNFTSMITEIIEDHKKTYSPTVTRDFIDAYLREIYEKPSSTFTEDQLIMVCLDFFIAGSQSTSSTLDFLFLHMILNPEIQKNVQSVLDEVFKPGDLPSTADRLKCPYIEAVFLECQRLSTVTPIIGPRRVTQDTTLGGYFIPKNTTVLLSMSKFNQNPAKWSEPEKLKPERFLDSSGRLITDQQSYFFGKGKRRCPGEPLARNFVFIFFAGILLNYKLMPKYENIPLTMKIVPGITQSPAEYHLKVLKRSS